MEQNGNGGNRVGSGARSLPAGGLRAWIEDNHDELLAAVASVARPLAGTPRERMEVALDLMDETVLTALGKEAEYNPDRATPGAWLVGIARFIARRRLSQRATDQRRVLAADAVISSPYGDGAAATLWEHLWSHTSRSSSVARRDQIGDTVVLRQWVAGLMIGLSETDQQVIRLSYFDELSGEEIARGLGISEAAARVRLCRAMQRLSARAQQSEEELSARATAAAAVAARPREGGRAQWEIGETL